MNIKDLFNKLTSKPTNVIPTNTDYHNLVIEQQRYEYDRDLAGYRSARMSALSLASPNRKYLYDIYLESIEDAHLFSNMTSRTLKTLKKPIKVMRNGKEDEKATELFNGSWFQSFIKYAQESVYFGFSLVQISSIIEGVPVVDLVPREHVKPVAKLIVEYPHDNKGYNYTDNEFISRFIPIGDENDLGILSKVAPLAIMKKNINKMWLRFSQLHGMPLRLAKTDLSSKERVDSLSTMLKQMSSSAYAVIGTDDSIEMKETGKSDGLTFSNYIKWIDEQISKVFLGGTMNSDNGSSRSQAEVHERLADEYSDYDLKNLTYVVNDKLIPRLIELGLDLTNCTFKFEDVEDTAELFEMVIKVLQAGKTVPNDWFATKFNIPVIDTPALVDKGNFQKPE